MNPTPEQESILDSVRSTKSNLMIRAYAGTGKTSTLELIDTVAKPAPHLYLCFNKSVANEAIKRMASMTTVRTFNSLGHRIWAQQCGGNLTLKSTKTVEIFRSIVDEAPRAERDAIWSVYDQVTHGVALAKALGYIPPKHAKADKALISASRFHGLLDEKPDDLTADLIDHILNLSIAAATRGTIDFNDQVYMPALFGGLFPKFPLVLVDEYQDLSPVNHAMIAKLCVASRQIGVGDDAQSIYGFRGAKAGGIAEAIERYSMTTLPLSISFRCPTEIVRNVHWRVPDFHASQDGGEVVTLGIISAADLAPDGTFICRNNAPLFRAALGLLGTGFSVNVAGTDIGPRLVKTMKRLGPGSMTQAQTISAIDDWLEAKLAKESKTAADFAECMKVFARQGATLSTAIGYAEALFRQEGTIRLMTGHKAKGLEFPHVYHLESSIIRETAQDRNLRYVIDTRSSNKLHYVSLDDIHWQ